MDDIQIHDTIQAHTVEDGEQIVVTTDDGRDHLENVVVDDCGEVIVISGYSHDTGDIARYPLDPSDFVDVWSL